MKADLDPATGQHRVPSLQVDTALSPLPVEFGTVGTQRVVKEVDPPEVPLADVAAAGDIELIDVVLEVPLTLGRQLGRERFRRAGFLEVPRAGLGADPGASQLLFVSRLVLGQLCLLAVLEFSQQSFARPAVGTGNPLGCLDDPLAVSLLDAGQQSAVRRHPLEHVDRRQQRFVCRWRLTGSFSGI